MGRSVGSLGNPPRRPRKAKKLPWGCCLGLVVGLTNGIMNGGGCQLGSGSVTKLAIHQNVHHHPPLAYPLVHVWLTIPGTAGYQCFINVAQP
nr:hypothetical protein [Thermostichus lividus]